MCAAYVSGWERKELWAQIHLQNWHKFATIKQSYSNRVGTQYFINAVLSIKKFILMPVLSINWGTTSQPYSTAKKSLLYQINWIVAWHWNVYYIFGSTIQINSILLCSTYTCDHCIDSCPFTCAAAHTYCECVCVCNVIGFFPALPLELIVDTGMGKKPTYI